MTLALVALAQLSVPNTSPPPRIVTFALTCSGPGTTTGPNWGRRLAVSRSIPPGGRTSPSVVAIPSAGTVTVGSVRVTAPVFRRLTQK